MKLGFSRIGRPSFTLVVLFVAWSTAMAGDDGPNAVVGDDIEKASPPSPELSSSTADSNATEPVSVRIASSDGAGVEERIELLPPTPVPQPTAADEITDLPSVVVLGEEPPSTLDEYSAAEVTIDIGCECEGGCEDDCKCISVCECECDDGCECDGECECECESGCECKKDPVAFGDWLGYNSSQSSTTWLAGDQMGMFSVESYPSLDLGSDSALVAGTGFHFLNGPRFKESDMPPRLFDFQMAYHGRRAISESDFVDLKFGVGAFSDFEGSARKGVRYPGHFVSYHRWNSDCISVLGVEVLDRDDISALPVGGFVVRWMDDLLMEMVFPRPRLQLRVSEDRAMYVAGELGGGTWAIERLDRRYDNATYRDLRVTFGVVEFGDKSEGVLEFGFAFDRSIEYRSTVGDRDLDSTFMLRCHVLY